MNKKLYEMPWYKGLLKEHLKDQKKIFKRFKRHIFLGNKFLFEKKPYNFIKNCDGTHFQLVSIPDCFLLLSICTQYASMHKKEDFRNYYTGLISARGCVVQPQKQPSKAPHVLSWFRQGIFFTWKDHLTLEKALICAF